MASVIDPGSYSVLSPIYGSGAIGMKEGLGESEIVRGHSIKTMRCVYVACLPKQKISQPYQEKRTYSHHFNKRSSSVFKVSKVSISHTKLCTHIAN